MCIFNAVHGEILILDGNQHAGPTRRTCLARRSFSSASKFGFENLLPLFNILPCVRKTYTSMYFVKYRPENLTWAIFCEPLEPYNWINSTDVLLL
jgi:hypothetical protein